MLESLCCQNGSSIRTTKRAVSLKISVPMQWQLRGCVAIKSTIHLHPYIPATPPNHGADDYSFALPSAALRQGPALTIPMPVLAPVFANSTRHT
jgi:hypothetical protein